MKMTTNFIIIDDDPAVNFVDVKIISRAYKAADVKIFILPEDALKYIGHYQDNGTALKETIVFLDINMPTMNGWEFLERYEKFSKKVTDAIRVFILSSSIDLKDKIRAMENKNVVDFLERPLTPEVVKACTSMLCF
jgi:response regulator RpfG family c-di-GMP phosphodiesterase